MDAARRLGLELAGRKLELVYGGAAAGLMGEVADSVMKAGGKAIGVIPKLFSDRLSHRGLTELHVVETMHERKTKMFDLADGFIALPGGFGTLEEIFEVVTWAQLGINRKPCGLLNVDGYFDHLLLFLDNAAACGFIRETHRNMLLTTDDPAQMLAMMESYRMTDTGKWVETRV